MNNSAMVSALREKQRINGLRVSGNSMTPIIRSGQKLKIEPVIHAEELKKGDIVFCKVHGNYYIHKITGIKGEQFQISNNHGHVNGWTNSSKIYGIVTEIMD
jgi:phage repressor protein C with HTH and peptisase S24 domain